MKIIELLNKIANGEEVPKRIKLFGELFEYKRGAYENAKGEELVHDDYLCCAFLNNNVEIIEEDKKIESIDVEYYKTNDERYNELLEEIVSFQEWCIDKVNSLEKKQ